MVVTNQIKPVEEIIKQCEESGFKYALLAIAGGGNYFFNRFEPDFEHNLPPEKKAEFEKNSQIAEEQIKCLTIECYNVTDYGRGRIDVSKMGKERGFLRDIPENCKKCDARSQCYTQVKTNILKEIDAYRLK